MLPVGEERPMRILLTIIAALLGLWIAFQIAAFVMSWVLLREVQQDQQDAVRRIEKEMRR